MTKYNKMEDNTGLLINTNTEYLRLACCSCGMVHTFVFIMKGNKHERLAGVSLRKYEIVPVIRREPRATAQLRRHEYGDLQRPIRGDKYSLKRG